MRKDTILVTGAGGFVCSEVVLALHRAGQTVVATDQTFDPATKARLKGVSLVEGPLENVLGDARLASLKAVVHGAAITASPEKLGLSNAAHIRRNMDLLTAVLDHAAAVDAAQFLFISSMGVFNPKDMPVVDGLVTETTTPTATCTYCAAKKAGELLTVAAAQDTFKTLSLRLGNVVGPHEAVRESRQHLCLVSRMIHEARSTGVITVQTPNALRDWSWLPDLAHLVAKLALDVPKAVPRVLHAGTPPVISDLDLAQAIAARVGDTLIRLAPLPHAAVRPPMASLIDSPFQNARWTAIDAILDHMTRVEVTV